MTAARLALMIGCLSSFSLGYFDGGSATAPARPSTGKLARITADRVIDLHSGREYAPARALRNTVVVFDSLSNPGGDPNGLLNLSFSDASLNKLCDPPDPNQVAFFATFGASPDACDPNTFAAPSFPSVGIIDNLDIVWDDYRMDTSLTGQDPNEVANVYEFTWAAVLPGGTTQYVLGFYEYFDVNGDGCFNEISAFQVEFSRDPNALPDAFVLSVSFDPNNPARALNAGTLLIDTVDSDPISGAPKCGSAGILAGGVTNDPNCLRPNDLIAVGSDLSALAGDFWYFANATQGDTGSSEPPWDPNLPIDTAGGACGTDPNRVEYQDIYQGALLLNIAFLDAQTDRSLAHGIPFQFRGEPGNSPPIAYAKDQFLLDTDRNGSEPVVLDGSLSEDTDGVIVNYRWTEGMVVLADGPSPAPTVALGLGSHPIELEVTDDDDTTDTYAITVSVRQPPLADAGPDQAVLCTDRVRLDGSASTDDGKVVNYHWTSGATVLASGPEPVAFVSLSDVGVQTITLRVRDDDGLFDTDEIVVEVTEPAATCGPMMDTCHCEVPSPDPCDETAPSSIGAMVRSFDGDPNEVLVEEPGGEVEIGVELERCYQSGTVFSTGQANLLLQVCGTIHGRIAVGFVMVRHTSEVTINRLLLDPASESVVTRMKLATGEIRANIDDCRPDYKTDFKVSTPNATAGVRGTHFLQSTGCLPYDSIALIDDGPVDILLDPNDPNTAYQIGQNERARVYADGSIIIETTPDLVTANPEIDFGDVMVGETLTLRPFVGNSTASPMTVHSFSVDGVPDPRPAFEIPPNEADSLAVSFTPTAVGPYTGTLEILYNLDVLVIPLHGNGTATPMPNCNVPSALCVPGCGGADLNRDCAVDLTDLAAVLSDFGCSAGHCSGDTDDDGDTDLSDLAEVLGRFGVACP